MLVDEDNSNILPLLSEVLERLFDRGGFRLSIDHKKVPFGIWTICDMLHALLASV